LFLGGFGKVYLVREKASQVLCVMKQVDLTKVDAKGKQEALHEVKFLRQFRHPNIIEYVRDD
jgi:serine/threonine protein kinase